MNHSFESQLNPEQWEVVRQGDGPVLVLAGAGSGKTRTITYRVASLLDQGVLPQQILLLTFTNKASKEMLGRVKALLNQEPVGLWGGTFHSVANRLLRMYARELGYTPSFTILDQEDTHALIKSCIKELRVDTSARRFPSPSKLAGLLSFVRNSNRSLVDVLEERYANFVELRSIIERIAETYVQHKKQADAMDFDDLLFNLRQLLSDFPLIRGRLSEQFRYILVDEYQDTNSVQADIVRFLSEMHGNVLVVGDDAQSIYSFRGAQIKNILQFSQTYPGTKTFRLTTNYRSTPEILQIANCSIEKNAEQFKKVLLAVRGSEAKPFLVPLSNSAQEAEFIAKKIGEIRTKGTAFSNIAVLFRAAFHSQALEFELMKRDIPYEYRGGLKFFERAHVKDVISFLRLKANPKDEAAWLRVLGLQTGIGLSTAQRVLSQVQRANDLSAVCEASISLSKRARDGWTVLQSTLRKLINESRPSELIRLVIASEYRTYVEAEYPDFMDRLEDLEQFALFAEQAKDLTTFLDEVSLTDEYGKVRQEGTGEDKVVLSTIHQSKGLEWDTVFVIHLVDGKFPNPRALEENGGLEEERRLFYVATTRARKQLFFTYPLVSGYESLLIQQPSLFLQELPRELFEQIKVKASSSAFAMHADEIERIIVFDELGEELKPVRAVNGMSFLRNIDELS